VAGPSLRAVTLDAFGTLIGLDAPAARLAAALRDAGHEHPAGVVSSALEAEMRYYRVNHDDGRDAATLAALHGRCAEVLAEGLGPGAPPLPRLTELLVSSLEFVLLPDAVAALDALRDAGYRLAVVSNWDYDLPRHLERLGVADRFEAVAVSATVGASKPSPALFHHALEAMGVRAPEAAHCGDQPEPDCLGARQAGLKAVLVDRAGRHAEAPCARIGALTDLPAALAALDGRR